MTTRTLPDCILTLGEAAGMLQVAIIMEDWKQVDAALERLSGDTMKRCGEPTTTVLGNALTCQRLTNHAGPHRSPLHTESSSTIYQWSLPREPAEEAR